MNRHDLGHKHTVYNYCYFVSHNAVHITILTIFFYAFNKYLTLERIHSRFLIVIFIQNHNLYYSEAISSNGNDVIM